MNRTEFEDKLHDMHYQNVNLSLDEIKHALNNWHKARSDDKEQLVIVMEELSELQKEVSKFYRGKEDHIGLVEELADVVISVIKIIMLADIESDEVRTAINIKIGRILDTLKDDMELEEDTRYEYLVRNHFKAYTDSNKYYECIFQISKTLKMSSAEVYLVTSFHDNIIYNYFLNREYKLVGYGKIILKTDSAMDHIFTIFNTIRYGFKAVAPFFVCLHHDKTDTDVLDKIRRSMNFRSVAIDSENHYALKSAVEILQSKGGLEYTPFYKELSNASEIDIRSTDVVEHLLNLKILSMGLSAIFDFNIKRPHFFKTEPTFKFFDKIANFLVADTSYESEDN